MNARIASTSGKVSNRELHLSRRATIRVIGGSLATVGAVASARLTFAQEATPAAIPPVLEKWLTVWGEDPAQADQLYAGDAVLEDIPGGVTASGLDAIRELLAAEFEGLPDHVFEVLSAFEAGAFAAMEVRETATYTGTYPGLPPGEGQPIDFRAAVVIETMDGLITREARYYDNLTLLSQFGVLELPEGEGEATPEV